ncbi:MAG TPA: hypothetical protein VFZ34_12110, partial [Blastocatellia bacterium]|nr:hypothetical protein [Blastocatellia bacterium]
IKATASFPSNVICVRFMSLLAVRHGSHRVVAVVVPSGLGRRRRSIRGGKDFFLRSAAENYDRSGKNFPVNVGWAFPGAENYCAPANDSPAAAAFFCDFSQKVAGNGFDGGWIDVNISL